MGQKQSKDQLLYHQVINGDFEGIQALYAQGASLEWKDKEGKTPLIVAAKDSRLYGVAKILIELGANVNAFSRGHHGGTPLHYAAKEGLYHTVVLLLSHGANALVKNDEHQTPLEIARKNKRSIVVREIENRICYFAGHIRETFGPGFSDATGSQLSTRVIWVVVVPRSPHNPPRPPKVELVIYATPQDSEPRKIISPRRFKLKEPKFDQPSPALIISDKHTKTRYKFSSVTEGDKQQLRRLYNACKGISQVVPVLAQTGSEALVPPLKTIESAMATRTAYANPLSSPMANVRNSPNPNAWKSPDTDSRLSSSTLPSNTAWVSVSPGGEYTNWTPPNQSPHMTNRAKVNPSAPPVSPDEFYSPDEFSNPATQRGASTSVAATKDESSSSSCVICWEAPVEGACVPCGHVSSCMSCLMQLKDRKGVCPFCRSDIDQVVKLYGI